MAPLFCCLLLRDAATRTARSRFISATCYCRIFCTRVWKNLHHFRCLKISTDYNCSNYYVHVTLYVMFYYCITLKIKYTIFWSGITLRRENKQTRLPVKRSSSYLHTIAFETTSLWNELTNISVSLIGYISVIDSTSRLEYDIIRREYFYSFFFRLSFQPRYRLFFGPLLALWTMVLLV